MSTSLITRQIQGLQRGQRKGRRGHRVDHVVREVERLERGEPREDVRMDDVEVVDAQVRVHELVQRRVLLRALGERADAAVARHEDPQPRKPGQDGQVEVGEAVARRQERLGSRRRAVAASNLRRRRRRPGKAREVQLLAVDQRPRAATAAVAAASGSHVDKEPRGQPGRPASAAGRTAVVAPGGDHGDAQQQYRRPRQHRRRRHISSFLLFYSERSRRTYK